MGWKASVQSAIRALKKDEQSLQKELRAVHAKIAELEQLARSGGPSGKTPARRGPQSNRLSAQGRAAISLAAKKRWAKYRSQKKKATRRRR